MISHVVLMKPRADLSPADHRSLADAFERAARQIPSVRGVYIGRRVVHGASYEAVTPDAADYIAVINFDNLEGLRAYLGHPAHAELGARFGQSLSSAMVYDFEVGGIDGLRAGGFLQPE
jgi:hypothetical protein